MNAIKHLDKSNLQDLKAEVLKHLAAVEQIAGVKFSFGTGNFDPTIGSATLKLMVSVPTASGESPEEVVFKRYAASYGLHPNCLKKVFSTRNGEKYRLIGMRDCRSKYKFATHRVSDGKLFYFTAPTMNTIKWEETF
jgi:hypothetical protein